MQQSPQTNADPSANPQQQQYTSQQYQNYPSNQEPNSAPSLQGGYQTQAQTGYGGLPQGAYGTPSQEQYASPIPQNTYSSPPQSTPSQGPYSAPPQEAYGASHQGAYASPPPQNAAYASQTYAPAPTPVYEPAVASAGIPPPVAPGPGLPKNHPMNPNKDAREAEHKAKIEAQKKKGFMGSIMGTLHDIGNSVQKGVDSSLGYWDQTAAVRYQQNFPSNSSETFLGEYAATIITGSRSVDGKIYLTSHSVGFVGRMEALKFIFPLNLIGSIQPVYCTVKYEANQVKVPIFTAANPPTRPNALHVFTKDNRIHQIYSITQFEYSYGTLDYAWRAVGGGQ